MGKIEKHGFKHHIIPTSLGGSDASWNIFDWTPEQHQAWHRLFSNKLPLTCIHLIECWIGREKEVSEAKLGKKRFDVWKQAFGDWSPEEVIRFIEKKFLPAENIFSAKRLSENIQRLFQAEYVLEEKEPA